MMKKLNLQRVIMCFVSLLLFVSCWEGGANKESGYAVGVVRLNETIFANVLDVSEYESFYSSLFANSYPGACFQVYYELDYDDPDNTYENVVANGFYKVIIIDKYELDRFDMAYSLTDTTKALADEVAIEDPILSGDLAYVKGMGFFYSILEIPAEQKMNWILSCDLQNIAKEENGQRYYDVFLRSTVYQSSSKSPENTGVLNAYNMKYYLEMVAHEVKSLGNTTFKLRFNYVSKIEDEILTWSQQESTDISVDYIIPAE